MRFSPGCYLLANLAQKPANFRPLNGWSQFISQFFTGKKRMGMVRKYVNRAVSAGEISIKSAALGEKLCKDAHFFCNFLQNFANRCIFFANFAFFCSFLHPLAHLIEFCLSD